MISVFHRPAGRRAWLPVLGPVLLAATVTAGCAASSAAPSPASSGSPGARGASFSQCLKQHGVTPPPGFGPGSALGGGRASGQPRTRPTGAAAAAFRNAMKACGAKGFPGGHPAG
ncbi:MAG TPA: hypothetical protein VGH77_12665 [Streptosporangiaceae bacterium]